MSDKQMQKGGDNSQQIQAGTVVVNNGISEERVRAIFDEKIEMALYECSTEAKNIAAERIEQFKADFIPKLVKANMVEELKDPSVQMLLIEAQKAAASTERPVDYSLLSELLIHRINKGFDRHARAGISKAVEIVDTISDEALLGLTVAHSVQYFVPVAGNISQGISILENLFNKVVYAPLSVGVEWIDHLDVLNAIRINMFGSLKKMNQWYPEMLSGYVDVGIEKSSDDYSKAKELIENAALPNDILCDHELRDGYVRLQIISVNRLDIVLINRIQPFNLNGTIVNLPISNRLTDAQIQAVNDIFALYTNDAQKRTENITAFMAEWDKRDSLKRLHEWWDNIPASITINAVGRVLAHANAQRCDPNLPPLD
jgi:hypothetical protein